MIVVCIKTPQVVGCGSEIFEATLSQFVANPRKE